MAFLRANGIVLHYEISGPPDGPVLAFANSLGSDFRIWREVVSRLPAGCRVLLYDKRGHGLSDAPPAPYSMDDHAADLAALLDALGIGGVGLVGLSVGGMIAQRIAVIRPDLVRALVLCGTAARIGTAELWGQRIAAVEGDGIASIADAILERWFTEAFRTGRPDELAGWRNMLVRTPVPGYAGTCAAIRDADLRADAPRIAVPTLCAVGDQDGSTPPDLVRGTADLIPQAGFEVIASAGHIPCIEQPDRLAALIVRHFREAALV